MSLIAEFSELILISKVAQMLDHWQNQMLGHSFGCENTLHTISCIRIDNIH